MNPFLKQSIGDPACPLFYRWTLFPPFLGSQSANAGNGKQPRTVPEWCPKLLVHHFLPGADERHLHDHPRGFWTIVLRGGYDDIVPCGAPGCVSGRVRTVKPKEATALRPDRPCVACGGTGVRVGDRMRAGMVRYRPARHMHKTRVHPEGCWTIVIMGRLKRKWGFSVEGCWMFWKDYSKKFGHGMRCA